MHKVMIFGIVAFCLMYVGASASPNNYVVAERQVEVFEKNHGKGKTMCTLKRKDKVSSRWDNNAWVLIETDKRTNCKGWVERKALKPA